MLDDIHQTLPTHRDQIAYTLGGIGGHKVAVAVGGLAGNRNQYG